MTTAVRAAVLALLASACCGASGAHAARRSEPAAIHASVSSHYTRTRLPDGSLRPETYAFGDGGCTTPLARDASLDEVPFLAVAGELVEPLAKAGYVVCKDPGSTELLVMVHWGATPGLWDVDVAPSRSAPRGVVPRMESARSCARGANTRCTGTVSAGFDRDDQAASGDAALTAFENRIRDRQLLRNAQILGFGEELRRARSLWDNPVGRNLRDQVLADLESPRYFVVLVAYDFQKAWKERRLEVLWTTRFSVRVRGHRFDRDLAELVAQAAPYFGCDTEGVVRGPRVPEGQVTFGPAEVLGTTE